MVSFLVFAISNANKAEPVRNGLHFSYFSMQVEPGTNGWLSVRFLV